MNNKYTELEKWKQLKDSKSITEDEYNAEKKRILNSTETNKPKSKGKTIVNIILIVIVVIGVAVAILIGINLKNKIQYETIEITTNDGIKLQVNKTNLDKGISEIEQNLSVKDTIGIVYKEDKIKEYLVLSYDSSKSELQNAFELYTNNENLRTYTVNTVNTDNGSVDNCVHGIADITISPYDTTEALMAAGNYIPNEYEIIIMSYDFKNNIKILNDLTNEINSNREENANLSILERAIKDSVIPSEYTYGITENELKELYENTLLKTYYKSWQECLSDIKQANLLIEDVDIEKVTTEPYEHIEVYDKSGINGIYNNQEYAEYEGDGSYSVFFIQNGKIEYNSEYVTYQGIYTQEDNQLLVTYTKAYGETGEAIELDKFKDKLIIESENKLVRPIGNVVYIKE